MGGIVCFIYSDTSDAIASSRNGSMHGPTNRPIDEIVGQQERSSLCSSFIHANTGRPFGSRASHRCPIFIVLTRMILLTILIPVPYMIN